MSKQSCPNIQLSSKDWVKKKKTYYYYYQYHYYGYKQGSHLATVVFLHLQGLSELTRGKACWPDNQTTGQHFPISQMYAGGSHLWNDNNDNNNHSQRRSCGKLSPTCTFKWPGHNCVQITTTHSALITSNMSRYVLSSATKFDRIYITFILALLDSELPTPISLHSTTQGLS